MENRNTGINKHIDIINNGYLENGLIGTTFIYNN